MRYLITVVIALVSATGGFAQGILLANNAPLTSAFRDTSNVNNRHPEQLTNVNYIGRLSIIPQDLYTTHFGFFCRQELKMQQNHIPVTFRLGSTDYCNWLEQKPGYR